MFADLRPQGQGLEASRPRPRTSKCVLEEGRSRTPPLLLKSLLNDLNTGLDDAKYCSQTEANIINKKSTLYMNIRRQTLIN